MESSLRRFFSCGFGFFFFFCNKAINTIVLFDRHEFYHAALCCCVPCFALPYLLRHARFDRLTSFRILFHVVYPAVPLSRPHAPVVSLILPFHRINTPHTDRALRSSSSRISPGFPPLLPSSVNNALAPSPSFQAHFSLNSGGQFRWMQSTILSPMTGRNLKAWPLSPVATKRFFQ